MAGHRFLRSLVPGSSPGQVRNNLSIAAVLAPPYLLKWRLGRVRIAQRTPKDKDMADETPPPPGAPGQPDRRRPAPTIDLAATEIASEIASEIANHAIASEPVAAAASGPEPISPHGRSSPGEDA